MFKKVNEVVRLLVISGDNYRIVKGAIFIAHCDELCLFTAIRSVRPRTRVNTLLTTKDLSDDLPDSGNSS